MAAEQPSALDRYWAATHLIAHHRAGMHEAAVARARAVADLNASGMPYERIAAVLGVSKASVQQLAIGGREGTSAVYRRRRGSTPTGEADIVQSPSGS